MFQFEELSSSYHRKATMKAAKSGRSQNISSAVRCNYWNEMMERLQAFQQDHNGSCDVPQRYRSDRQLANWVDNLRQRHRRGALSHDQQEQLEEIGFQWTTNRPQSEKEKWNEMFSRLRFYQQQHNGSCNVPKRYKQDPKLANWVNFQRQSLKKGKLAQERQEQLQAIGFEWTTVRTKSESTKWNEMFQRLLVYKKQHNGCCTVPQGYSQDPKLANWVYTQRRQCRKGVLAKDRTHQLDAIGFQWNLAKPKQTEGQDHHHHQQKHSDKTELQLAVPLDPGKFHNITNQFSEQEKVGVCKNNRQRPKLCGLSLLSVAVSTKHPPCPNSSSS